MCVENNIFLYVCTCADADTDAGADTDTHADACHPSISGTARDYPVVICEDISSAARSTAGMVSFNAAQLLLCSSGIVASNAAIVFRFEIHPGDARLY